MRKVIVQIKLRKKLELFLGSSTPSTSKILREDGTKLLRETGDKFLKE
jgi:hypothetical protein